MNPEIAVPLADGRWLAMPQEAFVVALRRAVELGIAAAPTAGMTAAPTERLVTSAGMAQLLGCHDTTLEQMAKDGRVPSLRLGRLLRFEPRAVLEALKVKK